MSHGARRYLLDTRFSRRDEKDPAIPIEGAANPNWRTDKDVWLQPPSDSASSWGRTGGGYKPGSLTISKLAASSALKLKTTIKPYLLP